MKIKWYGTASIAIAFEKEALLFDPFVAMSSELPAATYEQFARYENIFITHSHFDHIIDVPRILALSRGTVYCSRDGANLLLKDGVEQSQIALTSPGAVIKKGPFTISVLKGRHIVFDTKIILKTLFSRRTFANLGRFRKISALTKRYPEGEVFIYKIEAGGKTVLHLGSLNLDEDETYPKNCDLLTIPCQGRSDLEQYCLPIVELLSPKALYLHHFDDSFPPVSRAVNISDCRNKISAAYPRLPVIVPAYREIMVL